MKLRCLPLLLATAAGILTASDAPLLEVKRIYILPMSGGLDQYLANRINRTGRYAVVTDPKSADALLTDQVGTVFEQRYNELYPPPPPPPQEQDEEKDKEKEKDKDSRKTTEPAQTIGAAMSSVSGSSAARVSSFSRGKGNVFLVERNSRQVIWSTFLRPRTTRPQDMNRAADQIADRLDDDAGRKQKAMRKAGASASPQPHKTPPDEK